MSKIDWKYELAAAMHRHQELKKLAEEKRKEIGAYLLDVAHPAFAEVDEALKPYGLTCHISLTPADATLVVIPTDTKTYGETEYKYELLFQVETKRIVPLWKDSLHDDWQSYKPVETASNWGMTRDYLCHHTTRCVMEWLNEQAWQF